MTAPSIADLVAGVVVDLTALLREDDSLLTFNPIQAGRS
jgi:hypothetical protein